MSTEIAKAYVQIIPSAQGIKGAITNELGGEAESAGKQSGAALGSSLVGALKGVIAAAGIGAFVKSSLDAAGNIQQSFGGLDTLYGSASGALKEYAAEAYKAGIDANTYAEQAVSFGAALKDAYGGDTVKAAEAANAAIMAMADNSAKMGTDIGSVQAAYQGFAKGQYQLLDNLKLGYGGTKTEMQRLLADAEAFSGVHYDIDNLGDVYTAIGVIQENLELAGVAADEAKTTFSGSFGAMSAAWTNFMASMALGEGVDTALQGLITTASTFFFNNFLPLVGNLIAQIPTVITTAVPLLIQAVQDALTQLTAIISTDSIAMGTETITGMITGIGEQLPAMIESGGEIITNLISGITAALPEVISAMGEISGAIISVMLDNGPNYLEQGLNAVLALINGILQGLPQIIATVGDLASQLISKLLENAPRFLETGGNFVIQAIQGIVSNIPQIVAAIVQMITQLITTIGSNLPQFLQKGLEVVAKIAAGLIQAIPQVVQAIPQIVQSIINGFTSINWGEIGLNIIKGIANGLKNAGGILVEAGKNAAKEAFNAVKGFLGIQSPSKLFRDEVGAMMAEGMAIGFEDNVPTAEIENALSPMASVVPDAMGGNSSAYNYGGISINVYGAAGQSETALVDIIEQRINDRIMNRQAVFA